jgi:hypothetical protein
MFRSHLFIEHVRSPNISSNSEIPNRAIKLLSTDVQLFMAGISQSHSSGKSRAVEKKHDTLAQGENWAEIYSLISKTNCGPITGDVPNEAPQKTCIRNKVRDSNTYTRSASSSLESERRNCADAINRLPARALSDEAQSVGWIKYLLPGW